MNNFEYIGLDTLVKSNRTGDYSSDSMKMTNAKSGDEGKNVRSGTDYRQDPTTYRK